MTVQVVSPERILWDGQADMVITRTLGGGEIAFLPGHAPFVGALGIGVTRIRPAKEDGEGGGSGGGDDIAVAVHGGFVEVSNNQVSILSDVAELPGDIDVNRAQEAKARAEEALRQDQDVEREAALRRAHVRLETAGQTG